MGTPHSEIFVDVTTEMMEFPDAGEYFLDFSSLSNADSKQKYKFQYSINGRIDLSSFSNTAVNTEYVTPYQHETIPWSLIGTIIFITGLFYTYYLTVFRYRRYPSWYIFPMISFCGCYSAEQPLWKTTWIFAGIAQCIAQITITDTTLYKRFLINSPEFLRRQTRFWIAFHAFSSSMVGLFPLTIKQCEESLSLVNNRQIDYNGIVDYSAMPHYLAAIMAGIGGINGIIIGLFVYYYAFKYAEENNMYHIIDMQTMKRFFIFRIICAIFMLLGLMGFCVIGPIIIYFKGYLTQNMANFMSLNEWVLGVPMGLYDACISLENYYIVEWQREKKNN